MSRRRPRFAVVPSARQLEWVAFFCLLLSLALAARYVLINLMLPDAADPDEGVYLMVARLLSQGHPYSAFFFDQFWLFPQIIATAFRWFGDSAETGRLTVVAFALLGLGGMALLARQLGAKWAGPLVVLFGITNHYYLTQSRFVMTDVPSVTLMLWALVMMLAFQARGRRVWLAASAVFCTSSLLIKPLTVGFCLPLAYWMVAQRVTRENQRWRLAWREFALDCIVFGGAALVTASPFVELLDLPGEFQRTVGFHLDEKNWYAPQMALRWLALVSFVSENRMWLGLALVGALVACLRRPARAVPLLVGQFASILVLVELPPWWHHYTLLTPLVSILAAVGVHEGLASFWQSVRLWRARGSHFTLPPRVLALNAGVVAAFLLAAALFVHDLPQLVRYNLAVLMEPAQSTDSLTRYLANHFEPGDYLISDNTMVLYLADTLLPPSAVNLPYESTFRFSASSEQKLEESVIRYNVKAIVVTGPYRRNPQLMAWIESHFPDVHEAGGGASDTVFAWIYTPAPASVIVAPDSAGDNSNDDYEQDYWQHYQ